MDRRRAATVARADMIDHTSCSVSNFEKSKAFYTAALKPLGYTMLREYPAEMNTESGVAVAGFGADQKPDFWIGQGAVGSPVHIAIGASSREAVDAFYAAAIAAGGKDNGKPGLRPQYHANYYGAFVKDPDGHNIEAVCHR